MPRVKLQVLLLALFLLAGALSPKTGFAAGTDPFDPRVHAALGKMGAEMRDLLSWGDEVPGSVLATLWAWPAEKQRQAAALALHVRSVNARLTPRAAWRIAADFVVASVRFSVPLDLAVGVARAESGFNPAALSRAGATGVMQVMPDLHHDLLALRFGAPEEWSLVDPEKAVLAGSFLLAGYLGEEKTVEGALTRYLGAFHGDYQDRVARYRAEAAQALGH